MDVFYQTLQAVLRILYSYRSFLLVFTAATALLLFLLLRKRHGKLFAGIMLGIMSISIAVVLFGCYNAFLRTSYQKAACDTRAVRKPMQKTGEWHL